MFDIRGDSDAFREIFVRTPHPMFVIEATTWRFLAANPAAITTYGYSNDEFLAMTVMDIRPSEERIRLSRHLMGTSRDRVLSLGRWRHLRKNRDELLVDITWYEVKFEGRRARLMLAIDLTHQVDEKHRTRSHVKPVKSAFMATVRALASMVQLRDSYTATHQRRVGRVAVGLGVVLGMDDNTRAGLAIMGLLHDIGKIAIPVHILNKNGKLTTDEYERVKKHAQFGFDILDKLTFDWPVAESVLQHHERLDGSGYPRALKGKDILFEARILAVADVIDAIAERRPYHEALGVQAALKELARGRERLYDPRVVDAAEKLLESGYAQHA